MSVTIVRIWGALALATVVTTLGSSTASAEPPSQAQDLFGLGRDLRARGDCIGAIVLFRKASEVYPAGLGSLRNIAECEESLGQFASARKTWLELKRVLPANPATRYDGWAQDAEEAVRRLAQKVATLAVDLTVVAANGEASTTDGVDVKVNDERLAASLVGIPIDRDPGRYIVRASGSDGHLLQEAVVDLGAGDVRRVPLRVKLLSPSPIQGAFAASTSSDSAEPPRAPNATVRMLGWAAIGVGGASLVGAAISFLVYESARGTLEKRCPNYRAQPCDSSLRSTVSEGHSAEVAFEVFGVMAIAGVAGGAVLLAVSPPHQSRVALIVSLEGVSAVGRF